MAETDTERPAVIEPTTPVCVGARAPHVWLDADAQRLSTLDLFGHGLTLLVGVGGAPWRDAVRTIRRSLSVPLGVVTIGGAELANVSGEWRAKYGIDGDGAVLVRPNGHIAWRSTGAAADAAATLEQVIARVLGLGAKDRRGLSVSVNAGEDRRCA